MIKRYFIYLFIYFNDSQISSGGPLTVKGNNRARLVLCLLACHPSKSTVDETVIIKINMSFISLGKILQGFAYSGNYTKYGCQNNYTSN